MDAVPKTSDECTAVPNEDEAICVLTFHRFRTRVYTLVHTVFIGFSFSWVQVDRSSPLQSYVLVSYYVVQQYSICTSYCTYEYSARMSCCLVRVLYEYLLLRVLCVSPRHSLYEYSCSYTAQLHRDEYSTVRVPTPTSYECSTRKALSSFLVLLGRTLVRTCSTCSTHTSMFHRYSTSVCTVRSYSCSRQGGWFIFIKAGCGGLESSADALTPNLPSRHG